MRLSVNMFASVSSNVVRPLDTGGNTVYFAVIIAILFLGLIMGTFLFLKNLSLSKILEERTATLSTIFTSIPDILYCTDIRGVYTSCNPSFEKYMGIAETDIIGKNAMEIMANNPDLAKKLMESYETVVREKKALYFEERLVFPNGEERLMETIKTPLFQNGAVVGILGISRDITGLKEAMEEAKTAAEAKSVFLSRMSHEMRTPMNAIIGMTKIADHSDDVARLRHCLTTIGTSSQHLLGIINDVLDMSKIEADKMEFVKAPLNIEETLIKTCSIIIDNMERNRQLFDVIINKDLDLNYIADDLRLSQVIMNLLSNAIKFTPEGGKISLSVDSVSQNGNMRTLRFVVADTGIGMTEEQIGRLFNAFEQADGSISRKYGGTGLGLAITKKIVDKMDGRIWVESEYGSGSRFIFEISLELAAHQDRVVVRGRRPEEVGLLIVDSNRDVLERFVSIIEGHGMKADAAGNAAEAARLFTEARGDGYDFIFIAHHMPEADAIETVKQLEGSTGAAEFVVITTLTEWLRIEGHTREYNLNRYITKPLFPSSVIEIINSAAKEEGESYAAREKPFETPDLSDVSIILAEDVEINREIFLALLENTRIAVEIAENGLEAVSLFKSGPEKYDAIIMDIQMPEMDGYEATRTIRALDTPKAKEIPIIAMTANAFKEDIDRCFACGMDDHLSKPIDEVAVIEMIVRHVKKTV